MKTILTIEESAKLIELGVDPKMASMVSWKQTKDWERKSVLPNKEHLTLKPFRPMVMGFERFEVKDVFVLSDILSILPKEIKDSNLDIISTQVDIKNYKKVSGWMVTYIDNHNDLAFGDKSIFQSSELIDALSQMLIWCLENGYLKTEKMNLLN